MREEEEQVRKCDPAPPTLHKEDVEHIVLFGKVGGCGICIVRLCYVVVRSSSSYRVEEGKEGARDEGDGIDGEEDRLEGCGEERRDG